MSIVTHLTGLDSKTKFVWTICAGQRKM